MGRRRCEGTAAVVRSLNAKPDSPLLRVHALYGAALTRRARSTVFQGSLSRGQSSEARIPKVDDVSRNYWSHLQSYELLINFCARSGLLVPIAGSQAALMLHRPSRLLRTYLERQLYCI